MIKIKVSIHEARLVPCEIFSSLLTHLLYGGHLMALFTPKAQSEPRTLIPEVGWERSSVRVCAWVPCMGLGVGLQALLGLLSSNSPV